MRYFLRPSVGVAGAVHGQEPYIRVKVESRHEHVSVGVCGDSRGGGRHDAECFRVGPCALPEDLGHQVDLVVEQSAENQDEVPGRRVEGHHWRRVAVRTGDDLSGIENITARLEPGAVHSRLVDAYPCHQETAGGCGY